MKNLCIIAFAAVLLFLIACGGSSEMPDPPPPPPPPPIEMTRSFNMGFTPWLYEASLDAIDVTYSRLTTHGDIIKHQFLGGIPWQAALDQTDYHQNVENEITGRLDNTPSGTKVFLAIDSINTGRDSLAPNWEETDNLPLSGEWATRNWSSPEVIQAYLNFSIDLINRFQPTHFEYGTEASELILKNPMGYVEFVIFAQAIHTSLSALFPELKLMTSVALKSPGSVDMQLIELSYGQLMPYTDVLGISLYPYVFYDHNDRGDPQNLPNDWLSQIGTIAGSKPMAISETGWIGEDLDIPEFLYTETSDSDKQNAFAIEVLQAAEDMQMELVIWWTVSDFDTLWNNELGQDSVAKIWKDIGLYDENQMMRPALQTWDIWLNKTHTP